MRQQSPSRFSRNTGVPSIRRLLAPLLILLVAWSAAASAAEGEKRVALVVGNGAYERLGPLPNSVSDATSVARILREAKFEVYLGTDTTKVAFEVLLRQFLSAAEGAETTLFYYAGHGMQIAGANFLVPVDANLDEAADIETQTANINAILDHMRIKSKIQLVFLDACRNNPFPIENYWIVDRLQPAGARGLAVANVNLGSLIAFATEPGSVAFDGSGQNSPFTTAFVRHATRPNLEVRHMLTDVRRDVLQATQGLQVPWENSSLLAPFYFVQRDGRPHVPPVQQFSLPAGMADPVPLSLIAPSQTEPGSMTVTLQAVPGAGTVMLAGKPLQAGDAFDAAEFPDLTFSTADAEPNTVGMLSFSVRNEWGAETQGLVAITVTDGSAVAAVAEPSRTAAIESQSDVLGRIPKEAPDVVVGVGPVPLGLPDGPQDERLSIRVAGLPDSGMLLLGRRIIGEGETLPASELDQLAFEPARGSNGQSLSFDLQLEHNLKEVGTTTVQAEAVLDPCDALAAEPLDLQGVAPGLLPNDIVEEAIGACEAARQRWPGVARFTYQYGRALLANRRVEEALAAFREAADAGHIRAYNQLGYMYSVGAGVERDPEQAVAYFTTAAEKKDPYGMLSLGNRLIRGDGIEKDRKRGLELLLSSAELGHTYAMNALGSLFVDGPDDLRDHARANAFFENGVARGDIYSMRNLALSYMRGYGVEKDPARAYALFKQASDGGHPFAPYNVAEAHWDGSGAVEDRSLAKTFFELGAWRGDGRAALRLGRIASEEGRPLEAVRYFALAAALPNKKAAAEARDLLAGMDPDLLRNAIAAFAEETGKLKHKKKGVDAVVFYADAAYKKRNPRWDLF